MPDTADRSRRPLIVLLICACVGHGLLALYSRSADNGVLTNDSLEYLAAADNLRITGTLYAGPPQNPPSEELYSRRTPLYPVILLILRSVSGGLWLVVLFQVLLSVAGCVLIDKLLRNMGIPHPYRLVAAAVYLVYPPLLIYSHMVMTEAVLQFELLVMLSLASSGLSRPATYGWFNVVLAAAILTKPVMVFAWLPNTLFALYSSYKQRKASLFFLSCLPLVVICGWSARNEFQTGSFHYSSISSVTLRDWNTFHFLVGREGREHAEAFLEGIREQSSGRSFAEHMAISDSSCKRVILDEAIAYSVFHARGMIFFFVDPGRFDIGRFLGERETMGFLEYLSFHGMRGILTLLRELSAPVTIYLAIMLLINACVLVGFLAFTLTRDVTVKPVKAYLVMVVLYVAVCTGPLGASRFRLPVFPYLVVAATCAAASRRRR
jgi:hypothetical protein